MIITYFVALPAGDGDLRKTLGKVKSATVALYDAGGVWCVRMPGGDVSETTAPASSKGLRQVLMSRVAVEVFRGCDLWQVLPHGVDANGDGNINASEMGMALEVYRMLRRYALAKPAAMRGPWSFAELVKMYPAEAKAALGDPPRVPWCMVGEEPEVMAKIDYTPTDKDCRDERHVDPGTLLEAARQ